MAPTLAMSVTGPQPARVIGRAAPLAYVVAALGVGLVAYGFVRLSGHFAHAGSVYAFAGNTLGPHAGFLTGWALLGTYIVFPPVSIVGVATFGQAFLRSTGLASDPPWLPLALAAWALIGLAAARGIRVTTRSLLAAEAISVALILVLVAVIYVRLGLGDAPRGRHLNADWLRPPPGTSLSTVFLAATFGFLSFAGFEAAGSLGEEAHVPRRAIPRSLVLAVATGAVFYVLCMVAQMLAFGTDARGVHAFATAQAPLGDLATSFVGSPLADALDVGAMLSAFGAGLGGVAVASRMLFALGRDGMLPHGLARVSRETGAPAAALAVSLLLSLGLLIGFAAAGATALHTFFYLATIGVLSLLLMYVVTNLGAARLLGLRGSLLPACGIAVAGYTLYRNVWPVPEHPFDLFPYVVAAWLGLGVVVTLALTGFARRVRAALAAHG